jgi:hypothetical protein
LKLPNGLLEFEKPFKLFDMKKFQQNVNRELKRQYPERLKLETQVNTKYMRTMWTKRFKIAVYFNHCFGQEWTRGFGQSNLDHAHKCGCTGNAKGKTSKFCR